MSRIDARAELPLPQRVLESYEDLTKSERRLADILLENPDAIALFSASDLATQAKVSKATTARFFQRLGYPTFKTAQRAARRPGPAAPRPEGPRIGPSIANGATIPVVLTPTMRVAVFQRPPDVSRPDSSYTAGHRPWSQTMLVAAPVLSRKTKRSGCM